MTYTLTPLEFYDDPCIDSAYQTARARVDEPNRTLEEPYVLAFLGDVAGHAVLDLGCGAAGIARHLITAGARSYTGVEGSTRMAARAATDLAGVVDGGLVRILQANLESWTLPASAVYNTVLARMSMHYIDDLGGLLARIGRGCAPGAQLVFSVEHPVVTSSYDADWDDDHVPRIWHVRNYYDEGPRSCQWLGARVRKQHRTVETYFRLLRDAGFVLDQISEGVPQAARFADRETYLRRRAVPMYLTIRALAGAGIAEGGEACG
jgi:SAM-dependent methyltransferase